MKKRYILVLLLILLIPTPLKAMTLRESTQLLVNEPIYTEIAQSSATNESYLNCAENIYIPYQFVNTLRIVVQMIKVVVPIILIIVGMLDFGRVVLGKPDDQMKKAKKTFMSRIIAAGLIFLVVSIVEMALPIIEAEDPVLHCFSCILEDNESCKYVNASYLDSVPTIKPTPSIEATPSTSPEWEIEKDIINE